MTTSDQNKEYLKKYREIHKQELADKQKQYRENHKEEINARNKARYASLTAEEKQARALQVKASRLKHHEQHIKRVNKYYQTHKEEINAQKRAKLEEQKQRPLTEEEIARIERRNAMKREWYAANKEAISARAKARKKAKREAEGYKPKQLLSEEQKKANKLALQRKWYNMHKEEINARRRQKKAQNRAVAVASNKDMQASITSAAVVASQKEQTGYQRLSRDEFQKHLFSYDYNKNRKQSPEEKAKKEKAKIERVKKSLLLQKAREARRKQREENKRIKLLNEFTTSRIKINEKLTGYERLRADVLAVALRDYRRAALKAIRANNGVETK